MNYRRIVKYFAFPAAVLLTTGVLQREGLLGLSLSLGDVLNVLFVAIFVSVTWFYADETALLRRNANEQLLLLSASQGLMRALLVFRPIPAQPLVYRENWSANPPIDALRLGIEVVNAGGTAARDVRLAIHFYQAGLSTTSNGVITHDSEGDGRPAPTISALLPGEIRTFGAPHHWRGLGYSSSRFTAHIVGEYLDGIGHVTVDVVVDISEYMQAAVKTRMLDLLDQS